MAVSFKNENYFSFLSHLMISVIFYRRTPPLKSVTMATRNVLFPIFELQRFSNTYLGKVTKFQFFSCLGAAFKTSKGGGIRPPVPLGLKVFLFLLLFSDWLKSNYLKSRIGHGFLDIFRPIFLAL